MLVAKTASTFASEDLISSLKARLNFQRWQDSFGLSNNGSYASLNTRKGLRMGQYISPEKVSALGS